MNKLILFISLFFPISFFGQGLDFSQLSDGFYKDHIEVLANSPSLKPQEMYLKSGVSGGKFNPEADIYYVKRDSNLLRLDYSDYFGYVKSGVFYWNYKGDFYRLGMVGMLSHVIVTETVINTNSAIGPYSSTQQIPLVVHFKTGQSFAFEPEPLEAFLMENDYELYKEFSAIKKRKEKRRMMFYYLRKYNERF